MKLSRLGIQMKLIATFLVVASIPLLISNMLEYYKAANEIETKAANEAKLVAMQKAQAISSYFKTESDAIVDLASSPLVKIALEKFSEPFDSMPSNSQSQWADTYKKAMLDFYTNQFGNMYAEKTKSKVDVNQIINKLDFASLAAQYDFIATNDNPLGQKDKLVTPKRDSNYARTHVLYHTYFRNYLNRHALYDLFLVNKSGRIVYTVFKETDFSTSLRHGPWADTNIAKAFENSMKLKEGEVFIEDFANYTPSYEAPASFAATPIYKNNELIGSLMIQLPLDKISVIAGDRESLGEKGETLLLGNDLKLRADTFRHKDTHNVANSFSKDSTVQVESPAVKRAVSGETGFQNNVSYDGLKTLAYYMPIKIQNLNWYIVVELSHDEVFAGLKAMTRDSAIIIVLGLLLISCCAFFFGKWVATGLRRITEVLNKSSQEVSQASQVSASSATELSEASAEQAASLQETMASVEEISAMVNQNADSTNKARQTVEANQSAADHGLQSVSEMVRAIGEIKQTNDEILNRMEESSREFSEIVKIISEIGDKTKVINEIVFQTKLLSFNASVEAARAGEHGKGFAVVAEEVGNLAQMSGRAADEISGMLAQSIGKVNSIVENTRARVDQLVETGKDKIVMGQSTAKKCSEALDSLAANARSLSDMITQISHASKEQAQGLSEINKAMNQLDTVTNQNSSVAQKSSTQAEHLNSEATRLSETVRQLVEFVDGIKSQQDLSLNMPANSFDVDQAKLAA